MSFAGADAKSSFRPTGQVDWVGSKSLFFLEEHLFRAPIHIDLVYT